MTYYLAGPMSGIPQFNFPAFIDATEDLRDMGYKIISPAELDDEETKRVALASLDGVHDDDMHGGTWGDFLARDVKLIADEVEGIILLPDWQTSRGARLECFVGLLCGRTFLEYFSDDYSKVVSASVVYIKEELYNATN